MRNSLDLIPYWENLPEGFQSENFLKKEFIPPFFYHIIEKVKPKHIVELGSYKGRSILQMMKVCDDLGIYPKISCIDTWLGSAEHVFSLESTKDLLRDEFGYPTLYHTFHKNITLSGFGEKFQITIVPLDTTNSFHALSQYIQNKNVIPPELIFVDAGHDYNSVKMDIENYWTILSKGGLMFGDDYQWDSVKKAVDDCFENNYQVTEATGVGNYNIFYQYWYKFKE